MVEMKFDDTFLAGDTLFKFYKNSSCIQTHVSRFLVLFKTYALFTEFAF